MTTKSLFLIVVLLIFAGFGGRESRGQTPQTDTRSEQTILIVHGGWGGSWAFKRVDSLLRQKGFEVYRPQLTGQGDRRTFYHSELRQGFSPLFSGADT